MPDIASLIILVSSLLGAFKGRWLPLWVPEIIVITALVLLIFQTIKKNTRFMPIHSAAVWLSLTWCAGSLVEKSWGEGVLAEIAVWLLLISTPFIVFIYQRIHRRFNPVANKKLELVQSITEPAKEKNSFKEMYSSLKNKSSKDSDKENKKDKGYQEAKLIFFDLGETIDFQNK